MVLVLMCSLILYRRRNFIAEAVIVKGGMLKMHGIPKTYKQILILAGLFAIAVISSIVLEITIDAVGMAYMKQSIGVLGLFLVILSFLYSARKKKYFTFGSMKMWLKFHEAMTISGTVLVFVHTGGHFRAILPQITLIAMTIAVISGFIGAYLFQTARKDIKEREEFLKKTGRYSKDVIENELSMLASVSVAMGKWRKFHMPVVEVLFGLIILHVISAIYFTGRVL